MQAIASHYLTHDGIIAWARALDSASVDGKSQQRFTTRLANHLQSLLTTRALESTGEVSLTQSSSSNSLNALADNLDVVSALQPVSAMVRYAADDLESKAQELRQSVNETIQSSLPQAMQKLLCERTALAIGYSLSAQLAQIDETALDALAKHIATQAFKQVQHYGLQPLAHDDTWLVAMGYAYQLYHYTFYPELSKTEDARLTNQSIKCKDGQFWTVQGLLARSGIVHDDGGVDIKIYHQPNKSTLRGATRVEKYGYRHSLGEHEATILAMPVLLPQPSQKVLPNEIGWSGKLRRKLDPLVTEDSTPATLAPQALECHLLLREEIASYLQVFQQQQHEFDTHYEKYAQRYKQITNFLREHDVTAPSCWQAQLATFAKPGTLTLPIRATLQEYHDLKQQVELAITELSATITALEQGNINLTAIWLDIRGQHYINEPSYYQRAKHDKDPGYREMADMVETFVIEHELACCPQTDFSNMVSSQHLEQAVQAAQQRQQDNRRRTDSQSVYSFQSMAKSFHWLAGARQSTQPSKACHKEQQSLLKESIKNNMALAYQLANDAATGKVDFKQRAQVSRVRLLQHQNKRLDNLIQIYHKLGGRSLGVVALSNHSWFKATIGRHIAKLIRYLTKVFVGKQVADALALDLHTLPNREQYRNQYLSERNRTYIESYWLRAVKAQIKQNPQASLTNLQQAAGDPQNILYPHLEVLVGMLPAKQQLQYNTETANLRMQRSLV